MMGTFSLESDQFEPAVGSKDCIRNVTLILNLER